MEKESLRDAAEYLLKKEGQARGDLLLSYFNYIKGEKGTEKVLAIEKRLESAGVKIKASEIESLAWYPVGYEPLIVLAAMEEFGWTKDDVFNVSKEIVKLSLVMRTMVRFFVSADKIFEKVSKYWSHNYNFGEIKPVRKENKTYIIRINGYDVHPISCVYNAGYMVGVAEMAAGKGFKIEEVKCIHKGDDYHEYRIGK